MTPHQKVVPLLILLFLTHHFIWSQRVHLDWVDVNVSDHHLLLVVVWVFCSQPKVEVFPVPVNNALLGTFSVRNIVTVLYEGNNLIVDNLDSDTCPNSFFHVNFTVVQVSQAWIHGVLHTKGRARSLVLECHQEPLVLSVGVAENVHPNPFVGLLVP